MTTVGTVPDVDIASLTAGDDPAAAGRDQDLPDETVAGRLGGQRFSGGRVPAVDGTIHGGGQRFPFVREVQVVGFSVDAQPLFPGRHVVQADRSAGGGHRLAVRREGHAAGPLPQVAVLGERAPFLAGVHVKEPEEGAALSAERGQGFAVGRKRQAPNAVALPAVPESAHLLAGFHVPQPGEIVLLHVPVTATRHPFAVGREGDREDLREAARQGRLRIIVYKIADRLAAGEVDQVNVLPVGDRGDGLAVRREREGIPLTP